MTTSQSASASEADSSDFPVAVPVALVIGPLFVLNLWYGEMKEQERMTKVSAASSGVQKKFKNIEQQVQEWNIPGPAKKYFLKQALKGNYVDKVLESNSAISCPSWQFDSYYGEYNGIYREKLYDFNVDGLCNVTYTTNIKIPE